MNEENLNVNNEINTPVMETPTNETPFVEETSTPVMEEVAPTPVPEPTPIEEPSVHPIDQPIQPIVESAPEPTPIKEKKGNSLLIVVIILIVLLLGAIGYIAYDKLIVGTTKCNVETTKDTTTTDTKDTTDKKDTTTTTTDADSDTKVVGDDTYGYIAIPKNWATFSEVGGSHSLQWTYATVFTVSLDYIGQPEGTAQQYASSFYVKQQSATDITGLTAATVKVGKNDEYTAYQVYMFYPTENKFLITYWFDTNDGKVRYLAIEGPEKISDTKITDLTESIPKSFSLKK